MKVGDLVTMQVTVDYKNPTGIVIQTNWGRPNRVHVYWIEDGEASWEPMKWLEVISASR